ncbi:MAG: UDP-N-acetylglucosamine 1-carboxyvinyltransferase [Clostridiales bacterium]|nr:UDP-N-acetylglucosamine 1-carboxyvinyltransferase [Clostridiales bacterium]
MNKLIISGQNKLYGKVEVMSAKNALLPLIASCVLLDFEVGFLNCPKLGDVVVMLDIIKSLGGKYRYDGDTLYVDCSSLYIPELPCELSKKIRASIFLLGPLIARFRRVSAVTPGGCNFGERPIDIHLDSLRQLGVEISGKENLYLRAEKLIGSRIRLPFPSVGVTENLIMASCLADGETVITNCAKEPEIVCLCNFLNKLGAKIVGAGTSKICVEGVKKLTKNFAYYKPITDRVEVGTYLLATLNTGGEVEINGANFLHNVSLIKKIYNNTCKLTFESDKIYLKCCGVGSSLGFIKTGPYPAFPTDLQSPILAYACSLSGKTIIEETVFKNRFSIIPELKKMNADITLQGSKAIVNGKGKLNGAILNANDLRSGAGLIISALGAEGVSEIIGLDIIERGYFDIDKKLRMLGANVTKG